MNVSRVEVGLVMDELTHACRYFDKDLIFAWGRNIALPKLDRIANLCDEDCGLLCRHCVVQKIASFSMDIRNRIRCCPFLAVVVQLCRCANVSEEATMTIFIALLTQALRRFLSC